MTEEKFAQIKDWVEDGKKIKWPHEYKAIDIMTETVEEIIKLQKMLDDKTATAFLFMQDRDTLKAERNELLSNVDLLEYKLKKLAALNTALEAEREFWGNEFSAVCMLKEERDTLRAELERVTKERDYHSNCRRVSDDSCEEYVKSIDRLRAENKELQRKLDEALEAKR